MARKGGAPENMTSRGRRFKPGIVTNPFGGGGSRMYTLVTHALREKLGSYDRETKKSFAERIADILIDCAINPDPELDKTRIMALSEIIDRTEGKPKQQIDVNDITADLRNRPTEDLMFHLEHGYWPEEELEMRRRAKMLEASKTEIQ